MSTHYVNAAHPGMVLAERERNGYHDSDWQVTVWRPEIQDVETFDYASTRGPFGEGNNPNGVVIDASPGVRARADMVLRERSRAAACKALNIPVDADKLHADYRGAADPRRIGNTVTVYKGRKVPKGTTGRVIHCNHEHVHTSRYGTWSTYRDMLMIDTGSGVVLVDSDHCRTVTVGPQVLQEIFDLSEAS